jgi:hypothetical protein
MQRSQGTYVTEYYHVVEKQTPLPELMLGETKL